MKILLAVGIPIAYVFIGSIVGSWAYDHGILNRGCSAGIHASYHDCPPVAALCGFFWPVAVVAGAGYWLTHGKARKKTRLADAQKLVRKSIKDLERELGL